MPKFSNQMPTMEGVFKHHPRPEAIKGLLETYRLQAKTVLQESMPSGIARLQALIAAEFDPTSPLWVGQIDKGAYKAENLRLLQSKQVKGTSVVKPKDIQGVLTDQMGTMECWGDTSGDVMEGEDDDGRDVPTDGTDVWKTERPAVAGHEDEVVAGNGAGNGSLGVDPRQKVGAHWFEVFAKNPNQEECIRIVRKEAETLMFCLNDLRVWLSLEVPVIEDGNSFGADVQSHMSTEIDKCFNRATGYMNGCKRHYDDRASLVKNWVQMPNVADYPASIAASVRIDHILLRSYLRNMLIIYGGILSNLEKNWVKIVNPKGQGGGGDAMY